ncbi:hypothetical protein [Streptomyces antibioticus]|uniref:hypothetical protein n=1 Tax=Streptomyces antibioticus TaxID=1890 RepID=UPI0036835DA5
MDAQDEDPLPPPAPFMWACARCTVLLRALGGVVEADAGCFYEQLAVARHVVEEHPEEVPPAHTDGCEQCPHYAARGDGDPGGHWAEHRARGLFLPPHIARLL